MIGLEDRQSLSQDIGVAHAAGARLHLACEIAGIDLRTLQRWKAREGLTAGDGRPQAVRPVPNHALSDAERAELVRVANEPRFAAVPPARIVPMLADDGVYLTSVHTRSTNCAITAWHSGTVCGICTIAKSGDCTRSAWVGLDCT